MNAEGNLFRLTSKCCLLPFAVDCNGKVVKKLADNIPMLKWPDGRLCVEASLFMLYCYRRNLSRRDSGGTLANYAHKITLLLRFCHKNKINLIGMSDSQFSLFIRSLGTLNFNGEPERKPKQVKTIGRICLDLLTHVGLSYSRKDFVSPKGTIRAEYKQIKIKTNMNTEIVRSYWHHHSFPKSGDYDERRREPISKLKIAQLIDAIPIISNSTFIKRRRYTMIKLYEITGSRRYEVANVKVDDVYRARAMKGTKLLTVIDVKKGNEKSAERKIPITTDDLDELIFYIEKYRRRIIRNTIGIENDHGILIISETTGNSLVPRTLSNEIIKIASEAGIEEEVCGHMFRHRYITKLFVALIQQHNFQNQDSFRKALLDTESLKVKTMELTGHLSQGSLERYISLAFDEITEFGKTWDALQAKLAIESFQEKLRISRRQFDGGNPSDEFMKDLVRRVDSLLEDLSSCVTITNHEANNPPT